MTVTVLFVFKMLLRLCSTFSSVKFVFFHFTSAVLHTHGPNEIYPVCHAMLNADSLNYMCICFQSVGQRVIMECVSCEINLLKRDVKMNDYSKASVTVLHHHPGSSALCFSHRGLISCSIIISLISALFKCDLFRAPHSLAQWRLFNCFNSISVASDIHWN